jgi:hypothetical protein
MLTGCDGRENVACAWRCGREARSDGGEGQGGTWDDYQMVCRLGTCRFRDLCFFCLAMLYLAERDSEEGSSPVTVLRACENVVAFARSLIELLTG